VKVLLVKNPSSGSAGDASGEALADRLRHLGDVGVLEPESAGSAPEEIAAAARDRDAVVVAGGDGTVSQAVNALELDLDRLLFGLIPAGTGNDLARTLDLPDDPATCAAGLNPARTRRVDVGRIEATGVRRLFINACLGGFPVAVDDAIDEDTKRLLGPLAFWVGGAKAALDLKRFAVTVNGVAVQDCVAVGIGNGRTAGGGIELWPEADPGDGRFDVCALGAPGLLDAARVAVKVKAGTHRELEAVHTVQAERVVVDADPTVEFNADGEIIGALTPVTFSLAGALRMMTVS
jgi:diacylglycerol kinase (ATP)